jgi:hypothetical protein
MIVMNTKFQMNIAHFEQLLKKGGNYSKYNKIIAR